MDVRKDLYGNVVLTGGTAGFAGLRDRLEKELADLAPQMAKVKVRCWCMAARCAGVEWQCRAKRLVDGAAGWRGAKLTWRPRWPRLRCAAVAWQCSPQCLVGVKAGWSLTTRPRTPDGQGQGVRAGRRCGATRDGQRKAA